MAHFLGGVGLYLGATYAPVFNPALTAHLAGRLLVVGLIQGMWEAWQIKETEGYPWWSGALDLAFALLGAAVIGILV